MPDHVHMARGDAAVLRFEILSVKALFFGTGIGMLVFELGFERTFAKGQGFAAEVVLEVLNLLARAQAPGSGEQAPDVRFYYPPEARTAEESTLLLAGLGAVARLLIGECESTEGGERYRPMHWNKAFAFTQLQLARVLEEGERWLLSNRLARKETTDYLPLPGSVDDPYRPFAAITHVASLEGGAVLVEPTPDSFGVEFLSSFVGNSGTRAYLPLALWAYHDYLLLSRFMAETDGLVDFRTAGKADVEALTTFRNRIYNFRFHYRFSHASTVTMHNEMFRRWRRAFDLQSLLDEVGQDVVEAENYLESRRSEHRNQQEQRNNVYLTVVIAIVGVLVALPQWTGIGLHEVLPLGEPLWRETVAMIQAGLVSAVIILGTAWVLWRSVKRGDDD